MESKLTLKLNKTVIDSAKSYAKKHNRSLSRMVEHYFINLTSGDCNYPPKYSAAVENLTGILTKDDLEKFTREDDRARYILT